MARKLFFVNQYTLIQPLRHKGQKSCLPLNTQNYIFDTLSADI